MKKVNKASWTNYPFNNRQFNPSINFDFKKIETERIHSGIGQSQSNDDASSFLQDTVLKYLANQVHHPFFTDKALADMKCERIPSFEQLYRSYLEIKPDAGKLLPAINFLPVMRKFSLTEEEIDLLLNNPELKHVLVQNEQVKIIVIRWQPGEESDIHGHAVGGGLVRVLHGEIEEKRYTSDSEQRLLSNSTFMTDHITYIDDIMGLHSCRNNQAVPALTLHIYTSGN